MDDKRVLVSIIVPVYNTEKYLRRCLNSLVNQTLKSIEIICIDDGSVDNSINILEEFAQSDSRIKILNGEHFGVSAARNKGMDYASGEYLGFVDSDDWVDLDFFEKLYNAAARNDADIAVAGIMRLSKFRQKYFLQYDREVVSQNSNEKFLICDVPAQNYVWNKIYKLSEIRYNNIRFSEGVYYEDIILTPQLIYCLEKLVAVPDTYYYYWRTSDSIVSNKGGIYREHYLRAMEKSNKFMREHGIDAFKLQAKVKRYRFLGLTLFKMVFKYDKTEYYLFNIHIYCAKSANVT